MSGKSAEEYKELGNVAFAEKDFDLAIQHYSDAIKVNPNNHVYFSNRSASYGGNKDWKLAETDAKECIRLDPTFLKGYYRLATAQIEMEDWNAAAATIKQGLNVDANSAQLLKLMRTVKQAKKAASRPAAAAATRSAPKLDAAASTELMDLQQQYIQTNRELNTVKANIVMAQREQKSHEITKAELEKLPEEDNTKMYRGVGKMFLLSSRTQVMDHLTKTIEDQKKRESDLTQKLDYLERRMASQQQNMEELMRSPSSAE